MNTLAIEKRYNSLAGETCCLSCGGAINFAAARQGEVVLDLGCGRGNDVIRLAGIIAPDGKAIGIDISDEMLTIAKRTAEKTGVKNIRFIKSVLSSIPLPDESVDLVISNCTINHATSKEAVWKEVFRVLKVNGRFVVSDIYSTAAVSETYRDNPELVAQCWAGADTKVQYLATLARTGFRNVVVYEESAPYAKGEIEICSFTISGDKSRQCCGG